MNGGPQRVDPEKFRFPTAGDVVGGLVMGVIWVPFSFVLFLAYAAAEDNMDMSAVTPWPLRAACALVFYPMRYIGSWDRPFPGLSDQVSTFWVFFGMFLNGVLWGLLFILLWRFSAHVRTTRKFPMDHGA